MITALTLAGQAEPIGPPITVAHFRVIAVSSNTVPIYLGRKWERIDGDMFEPYCETLPNAANEDGIELQPGAQLCIAVPTDLSSWYFDATVDGTQVSVVRVRDVGCSSQSAACCNP